MIVFFLLTMLVVVIPALHFFNNRYVQRIALFIGSAQLALLAFSGRLDNELSNVLVNGCNQLFSFSLSVVIHKIFLLISLVC